MYSEDQDSYFELKSYFTLISVGLSHFCCLMCSGSVVPGAGAFEVAVADALVKHKPSVKGRAQLGVKAFADALLVIPKVAYFNFPHKLLVCVHLILSRPSL